jgi:hypothetical protein
MIKVGLKLIKVAAMAIFFVIRMTIFAQNNSTNEGAVINSVRIVSTFADSYDITGNKRQEKPALLKLDFPLVDLPYQKDAMSTVGHGFFGSYANPGMTQSLAVTTNMVSAFHYGMRKFYDSSNKNPILKNIIFYGGAILGDVFFTALPPIKSGTWMHEEYHRAVMSRYGVNSFNSAVYTFGNIFGGSVTRITDEDLERFKAKSPTDFIRMHEAGFEAENLLIDNLQKNNFFYNKKRQFFAELDFMPIYWIMSVQQHVYITAKGSLEEWSKRETAITERDINGSDPVSWVYDLFRPDEPYSARGSHPSGIGINRYRQYSDLSDQEQRYLKKVGYWHFANYISPMMFGFRSLPLGNTGIKWNYSFRHFLTPFGTDLSFKMLLNRNEYNFVATYHNYRNYGHTFPAIEGEMIDRPIQIGNFNMLLSPKIMIGTQPKEQNFFTSKAKFFGSIGTRADFQINRHLFPYLEITAKTDGWIAGNEFLENNAKLTVGLSARFY